jgi:uncharacterized protein YjbJ (UPF0337 family)
MNTSAFERHWARLRGRVKSTWGRLTDDELDRIGGRMDHLVGLLQVRYEYTLDEVEDEIDRLVDRAVPGAYSEA